MASAAPVSGDLTPDVIRGVVAAGGKPRISTVQLIQWSDSRVDWRCSVYLLRARANGFMVLLPDLEEVHQRLGELGNQTSEMHVGSAIDVQVESVRGKALGPLTVLIADLPWSFLVGFQTCPFRNPSGVRQLQFRSGDSVCRPLEASALEVSATWIGEVLEEATGQEYTDALEDLDGVPWDDEPEPSLSGPMPSAMPRSQPVDLQRMQEQLDHLQKMVSMQALPPAPSPAKPTTMLRTPTRPSGEMSPQEVRDLRMLVGAAPTRLGRSETLAVTGPSAEDRNMAELDREVAEAEVDPTFLQSLDPTQRLLYMQMQQTNALMKSLVLQRQPPQDPLSAVLNVADSGVGGSTGSSVNVKGYIARDAFLKHLEDDQKVVAVFRANARLELGVSEAKEEPSLLRQYLEQRIPIADHRLLGQLGYLAAWGWEKGAVSDNVQMMAFCGRLMRFVEQASLDNGKSTLAWLLTGLPEVNHQVLSVNRRRQSLTPFAKLPAPAWVAANVSFLKDIDTFETRLRQLGAAPRPNPPAAEPGDPAAKAKTKPKKPKGGAKGTTSSAEPAPP